MLSHIFTDKTTKAIHLLTPLQLQLSAIDGFVINKSDSMDQNTMMVWWFDFQICIIHFYPGMLFLTSSLCHRFDIQAQDEAASQSQDLFCAIIWQKLLVTQSLNATLVSMLLLLSFGLFIIHERTFLTLSLTLRSDYAAAAWPCFCDVTGLFSCSNSITYQFACRCVRSRAVWQIYISYILHCLYVVICWYFTTAN